MHAKANFLGKVGDREAAAAAYKETEDKTASGGSKADMVFSQIRWVALVQHGSVRLSCSAGALAAFECRVLCCWHVEDLAGTCFVPGASAAQLTRGTLQKLASCLRVAARPVLCRTPATHQELQSVLSGIASVCPCLHQQQAGHLVS